MVSELSKVMYSRLLISPRWATVIPIIRIITIKSRDIRHDITIAKRAYAMRSRKDSRDPNHLKITGDCSHLKILEWLEDVSSSS